MGSGGAGGAPSSSSSSSGGLGGESEVASTSGTGGNNEGGCDADLLNDPQNCGECGRACWKDERVDVPRCVEGVCASFCASGFVNFDMPESGEDDGCEADGRRVFVTADAYPGSQLGGESGADNLCQGLANAQKLGGKWRAWLSGADPSSGVASRFEREPPAPYVLLDATPVADSWEALTVEGALDNPIILDETMSPVAAGSSNVWTGTRPNGLPSDATCAGWNSVQAFGTVGDCTSTSESWTASNSSVPCTSQARLYCFEQ